jgi:hypothetical protein
MMKMIMVAAALMLAVGLATAGDAKIKAMVVGTWRSDCNCDGSFKPIVYKADGTLVFNLDGTDFVEKWWVKNGDLVQTDYESQKGKIFYIPGDSLGDSPDWTGLNVTPPEPSSSEDDAKWAKAPGGWADEVAERPSNAEASAAMNKLQDAKGKPHVKGGVWYDDVMKTYNWIGPKSGKKMSENTDEFWSEVGPYLNAAARKWLKEVGNQ